tara:strand:- start:25 stop:324 length:300 start_codon:yes stop_codon:yes gene_type:complete
MVLQAYLTFHPLTYRDCQKSIDISVKVWLDQDTDRCSTNNLGNLSNNMRRECIRKDHLGLSVPELIGDVQLLVRNRRFDAMALWRRIEHKNVSYPERDL